MRVREGRALRPTVEVRLRFPARQDDIAPRRRAVLQYLESLEAWHLVHLARALRPTLLKALRRRNRNGDMKQRDDHETSSLPGKSYSSFARQRFSAGSASWIPSASSERRAIRSTISSAVCGRR